MMRLIKAVLLFGLTYGALLFLLPSWMAIILSLVACTWWASWPRRHGGDA